MIGEIGPAVVDLARAMAVAAHEDLLTLVWPAALVAADLRQRYGGPAMGRIPVDEWWVAGGGAVRVIAEHLPGGYADSFRALDQVRRLSSPH